MDDRFGRLDQNTDDIVDSLKHLRSLITNGNDAQSQQMVLLSEQLRGLIIRGQRQLLDQDSRLLNVKSESVVPEHNTRSGGAQEYAFGQKSGLRDLPVTLSEFHVF